jgi:hypothetical protein
MRVNTVADCTVPEKILLAADQLEKEGQSPFSAEALIVAAWQKFPKAFGLKGYTDLYPDSNKVLSSIMGVKGLASKGWLLKVGQKMYTVSREGRQVVRKLLNDGESEETAETAVKLTRDQEKFLHHLFGSSGVQKYEEGRKQDLTFGDACRFWNISENTHGEQLNARLHQLRATLADIDRLVGKGVTELSNGRVVTLDDIAQLSDIHAYLEERFSRHLTLLRNRSGKP